MASTWQWLEFLHSQLCHYISLQSLGYLSFKQGTTSRIQKIFPFSFILMFRPIICFIYCEKWRTGLFFLLKNLSQLPQHFMSMFYFLPIDFKNCCYHTLISSLKLCLIWGSLFFHSFPCSLQIPYYFNYKEFIVCFDFLE